MLSVREAQVEREWQTGEPSKQNKGSIVQRTSRDRYRPISGCQNAPHRLNRSRRHGTHEARL